MLVRTGRPLLREFNLRDWRDMLVYQSNPKYLEYYPWEGRTEQDVREFVQKFIDWQGESPRTKYQLAITFPEQPKVIGNCGIRKDNKFAKSANIGYEIAPEYWGSGYATEAALAIVTLGFRELKLHRIWAHCLPENIASWRVLEKIGMQREGHLREMEFFKGIWRDSYIYAILDYEWKSRKSVLEGISF